MTSNPESRPPDSHGLTRRERQILILLSDGATSAQIAHAFGISANTVDEHIASARKALGARNRTELVTIALREGIDSSEPQGRPVGFEVEFGPEGEVLETTVRYTPGDAVRGAPVFQKLLDVPASGWTDELVTNFEVVSRSLSLARDTEEWVPVEDVSARLPGSREPYVWSGAVQRLGNSRFLLRIATPYPGQDRV